MNDIFHQEYWFQSSRKLKISADILIKEVGLILKSGQSEFITRNFEVMSLIEINLLLLGYAIENAGKGNLIGSFLLNNNIPPDCSVKWLSRNVWKTSDHNLSHLVERTQIETSLEERILLEKLTKYVTWKGRYHIPRTADDIMKSIFVGEGDRHTSQDQVLSSNLLERLMNEG